MKKLARLVESLALAIIVTVALVLLGLLNGYLFFNGYETELGIFWVIVILATLTYAFYEEIK